MDGHEDTIDTFRFLLFQVAGVLKLLLDGTPVRQQEVRDLLEKIGQALQESP
jgi:hypothetical protein